MSFVAHVVLLKMFCRGEKMEGYHLKYKTRYVRRDLKLAVRWLLVCGIDVERF